MVGGWGRWWGQVGIRKQVKASNRTVWRFHVSKKCLSVITHQYYAHNRIQLWVLHSRQDSLTSIQLLLASTRLHNRSNCLWAVCFSCCTSPARELSSNFSRHDALLAFFVNLDVSCTVNDWYGKVKANHIA